MNVFVVIAKMAVHVHIPIWFSLAFVALVLLSSVVASLIWAKHADTHIDVDLPEDFDSPFEDDDVQQVEDANAQPVKAAKAAKENEEIRK